MSKSIMIGRSSSNDYVIDDDYASREHAQILLTDDDEIYIIDLDSKSGTTVNGRLLVKQTPYKLNEYDIVRTAASLIPWKDFLAKNTLIVHKREHVEGNLNETIMKPKENIVVPKRENFILRFFRKIGDYFS